MWQDKYLGYSWGVGLGRGVETGEKRKAFIAHLTCFVINIFFYKKLVVFLSLKHFTNLEKQQKGEITETELKSDCLEFPFCTVLWTPQNKPVPSCTWHQVSHLMPPVGAPMFSSPNCVPIAFSRPSVDGVSSLSNLLSPSTELEPIKWQLVIC